MIQFEDFLDVIPQAKISGRNILGICPFHDDSGPSLLIHPDGWFRCLGCGRHGKWNTLWNKVHGQPVQVMPESRTSWNTPRIDNLEETCYQAHIDLQHFPSLGWYLEMRGIEGRIDQNELGYWDGWYTIPVYDSDRTFITAVLRASPHVQDATGLRYWCRHFPVMYVPDFELLDGGKNIFVVYGMVDALCLADLRLPVVTTTGGNLTFDPTWLADYRKPTYIIPDKGEEEQAYKLASRLGWRGNVIQLDYPDEFKDPADFFSRDKKKDLQNQLGGL